MIEQIINKFIKYKMRSSAQFVLCSYKINVNYSSTNPVLDAWLKMFGLSKCLTSLL